ncbi:MAG TPA: sulfotransferase, partial [Conexibacter sp.]|nr:sulfotransferase [Conexibacter sp.]
MRDATGARTLDFLVIGVQKGGTTSLWRYLGSHPRIRLPLDKEAPVLASVDGDDPEALARFVATEFADAAEDALLGTVTPHYMMGNSRMPTGQIAQRVAAVLPHARIVALLRDPIERAISQHRMSVRRGWEARSFDEAARELLEPARAQEAREHATETNAYLAQGEYGRILSAWREHVPAERTVVALSEQLDADP